mmetsp:Transcript_32561/g.69811  ORF Transcript_32561/g.69811 Transcript_32561/m.69811 type:complete len:183 (-) Transcript_32561:889-1437(-)
MLWFGGLDDGMVICSCFDEYDLSSDGRIRSRSGELPDFAGNMAATLFDSFAGSAATKPYAGSSIAARFEDELVPLDRSFRGSTGCGFGDCRRSPLRGEIGQLLVLCRLFLHVSRRATDDAGPDFFSFDAWCNCWAMGAGGRLPVGSRWPSSASPMSTPTFVVSRLRACKRRQTIVFNPQQKT